MLDFLFELFDLFASSNKRTPSNNRKRSSSGGNRTKTRRKFQKMQEQKEESSKGVNHHFKAEEFRKNGEPKKAVKHYRKAIGIWEGVSKPLSKAPAPYRELAKLYYHAGYPEKAVEVLDHYLDGGDPPKRDEMKELRDRLDSGDFRQLSNKYEFEGELA